MKNVEVIREFLRGGQAKTQNLKTDSNKLINYQTVIATINGMDELELNYNYYSQTTSKIQNTIIREAKKYNYIIVINATADRMKQAEKILQAI